jgi:hypothetical protein
MTDENSGETERTVVDISVERMRQENLDLKAKLQAATDTLEKIKNERDKATQFLEQNERGKAVDALKKMGCTYSVEEFDRMSLDELDQLKSHYRFFKPPIFQSGADISGKSKSVYDALDSIYVPLEERKKSLQEA